MHGSAMRNGVAFCDAASMGMPTPDAAHEKSHTRGDEPLWNESWYFDWAAADGSSGGYVRVGLYPNLGVCWYWASLVREHEPLVTVIDHRVPLPTAAGSLELRAPGLWADHNLLTPLEHWSLGLEAFALVLENPTDAYGPEPRGEQIAFGLDLEWETDGTPYLHPEPVERYEVPCHVHGEVLVGDQRLEVDAPGQRDHSWGVRDFWLVGHLWFAVRLEDGTRLHGVAPCLDGLEWAAGYVQQPDAAPMEVRALQISGDALDSGGLHGAVQVHLGDVKLTLVPVAWSPLALDAPDGRRSRFPRCLVRATAGDGRRGVGWLERNHVLDA